MRTVDKIKANIAKEMEKLYRLAGEKHDQTVALSEAMAAAHKEGSEAQALAETIQKSL